MDSAVWVAGTLGFGLYGQIMLKWRADVHAPKSLDEGRIGFVLAMLTDPWVLSGLGGAFLASISYMFVLQKLPLSYAFPLMALSFVFVPLASVLIFGGRIPLIQASGLALIVLGAALSALSR
ncbi:EamA family transporter [Microvirga roseola]|uniref:EamA family transporter n=1 Tax=Microvirga roseola TaxID=2883126 RepID=UPI001E544F33|nr:EamA family transporter [Microvirga roseola]